MGEWKKPKTAIQIGQAKGPIASQRVSGAKEPQIADRTNLMQLKACWRVKRVQVVDPYGWHDLTASDLVYIRSKLSEFETMTWNEIFIDGKKWNHSIQISQLRCAKARKWLRDNLPDQLELWTIRFNNRQRVWGIFGEGAYQIIFWDPTHQIMPTLA
jgi:hypothetical protein